MRNGGLAEPRQSWLAPESPHDRAADLLIVPLRSKMPRPFARYLSLAPPLWPVSESSMPGPAFLAAILLLSASASAAEIALKNPDFESAMVGKRIPGWSRTKLITRAFIFFL